MNWIRKLFGKVGESVPKSGGEAHQLTPRERADDADLQAITQRLAEVYGEQRSFHYGALVAFEDGGPDPLHGVSIFWNTQGPHWHYVSFGLAQVMGAELTFRLRATPSDRGGDGSSFSEALAKNAPQWPIAMLNMLARRVQRTGRPFAVGHWWEGPPGVLAPHTEISNLAFTRDPELGVVATASGELLFLLAVGIDPETVASMMNDEREGHGDATLAALLAENPLLLTDAGG
ncbi:MAG: suppressor of fused domain protein [Deltaproteobacteria bacterium]|nr:suppressor of fused domain protein [Deltaproteobacteria bacterium]